MTGQALAGVALRVWGVILIVGALVSAPSAVLFVSLPPSATAEGAVLRASQIGTMLGLRLRVALGLALVRMANRIVRWVVPDGPPLRIDVYASELAALAFAIVGLYSLVQGAENIIGAVYTAVGKPTWPSGSERTFWCVWERERETIVRAFVQIAAGLVLMLGRTTLVNGWWWIRGGVRNEADSSQMKETVDSSQ